MGIIIAISSILIIGTIVVFIMFRKKLMEKLTLPIILGILGGLGTLLGIFIGLVNLDIIDLGSKGPSFKELIQANLATVIIVAVVLISFALVALVLKLRKSQWLKEHPIPLNLKFVGGLVLILGVFALLANLDVSTLGRTMATVGQQIRTNISNIITSILILSMFFVIFILRKTEDGKETIPAVVTILGILGTFSGVFIGLLAFDPTNIDDSIPQFLSGIKTAFITSIAGISLAILFKVRNSLFAERRQGEGEGEETVTLETLAKLMTYQQMMTESGLREIVESLSDNKAGPLLSQEQQQTNVAQHNKAADKLLKELKAMIGEQPTESQKN